MEWINLGVDVCVCIHGQAVTPPQRYHDVNVLVECDAGCDILKLEHSYEVLMSLLWQHFS
jgi:hypothetical protein